MNNQKLVVFQWICRLDVNEKCPVAGETRRWFRTVCRFSGLCCFFFCALSFSEDPTGLNQWTKRVGRNVAMVHRGLDRHLIDHSETDVSSEQLASLARLNYSQHPLLLPLSLSSNHALRTLNTKSGPSQDTWHVCYLILLFSSSELEWTPKLELVNLHNGKTYKEKKKSRY